MFSIASTHQELTPVIVGVLYIALGAIGVLLNLTTVVMIVTRRVYRLSAYTIMANVALADALVMLITGCACGATILLSTTAVNDGELILLNTLKQNEFDVYSLHRNKNDEITSSNVYKDNLSKFNNIEMEEYRIKGNFKNNDADQLNIQRINHNNKTTKNNSLNFQQLNLMRPAVKSQQRSKRFGQRRKRFWQMSNNFANRRKEQNLYTNTENRRQSNEQKSRGFGSLRKRSIYYTSPTVINNDIYLRKVKRSIFGLSLNDKHDKFHFLKSLACFIEITAWTAGITSYAILGLNRCVAICYYGTKAKTFNRVSVAFFASIFTWIVGICAACTGTFPVPLVLTRLNLWSISFEISDQIRPILFVSMSFFIYAVSVTLQWICSTLVLLKIRQVKKKISKNKLNQNSANRFRKQVWLSNHMCNPFIYAYFNERMRMSYYEILTCSRLRLILGKRRSQNIFKSRSGTRRSAHQRVTQQMSVRSVGANSTKSNGNFVRNSLQLQSRDFEQLCEFMMRVNPLYDSSEGWRESSDEDDSDTELKTNNMNDTLIIGGGVVRPTPAPAYGANIRSPTQNGGLSGLETLALNNEMHNDELRLQHQHRSSRSIVLDLGRQTVEHWAAFAKKASI